jgi:hypothetical protein
MTDSDEKASTPQIRLVKRDRVQVEFLIDDLIRQIGIEGLRPIASCNGCNNCNG